MINFSFIIQGLRISYRVLRLVYWNWQFIKLDIFGVIQIISMTGSFKRNHRPNYKVENAGKTG